MYENHRPLRHRRCVAITLCLSWLLFAAGCGEPRAAPVDAPVARATLLEVLETWKAGGTIAELRSREPAIVVQESLWSSGSTLEDFTVLDGGREEDANLFCEVELTLVPPDGGARTKKKVTYVIGTDPILTVFHAIL